MKTCPACGAPSLVHETRDLPYTYKGRTFTLTAVEGEFCGACGESVLDREAGDRVGRLMATFQRTVNADLVDPSYVVSVRVKLKLSQREAGELFGGGVNAFSRYETGKTRPPVATVKLLKLLDHHPDLLDEVRA